MNTEDRVPDIMDLELLTPGSVWVRKNGKESRFLFLTNAKLPEKFQAEHPQMAVYADEDDNVFSVPVMDFIAKRTFFNCEPGLETRLLNLLAFSAADDDTGFDLLNDSDNDENLLINDSEDDARTDGSEGIVESSENVSGQTNFATDEGLVNAFPVEFFGAETGLPEIISPQRLCELTECYQQTVSLVDHKYLHTLFIRAANGITKETLYASFSPTHVEQNAVYSFKVRTNEGVLDIDWDGLVGIYPYVYQHISMYQVVFYTEAEVAITSMEPAEAEQETTFVAVANEATGTDVIMSTATAEVIQAQQDEGFDTIPVTDPVADAGFVVTAL